MTRRHRKNYRDAPPEFAELALGPLDELGDVTAEFEGRVINVAGGIPGERVVARIHRYRRRRREIVSGIVAKVLEPSPDRIAPKCGYSGACSGCQWQHIAYEAQLALKRRTVESHLARYDSLSSAASNPPCPPRRPSTTAITPGSRQARRTTRLLQPHNPPLRQD